MGPKWLLKGIPVSSTLYIAVDAYSNMHCRPGRGGCNTIRDSNSCCNKVTALCCGKRAPLCNLYCPVEPLVELCEGLTGPGDLDPCKLMPQGHTEGTPYIIAFLKHHLQTLSEPSVQFQSLATFSNHAPENTLSPW